MPTPTKKQRPPPHTPPPHAKRRRRAWADIVEELALKNGVEEDDHRLSQRQKQIDYGKNTLAYDEFSKLLPRERRVKGDPMTPIVKQKCSKRSFMGQVTAWKKRVYAFVKALEDVREGDGSDGGKGEVVKGGEDGGRGGDGEGGGSDDGGGNDGVDDGEDVLSDMDDIHLDDFGNVISTTDTTSKQADKPQPQDKAHEDNHHTPPSIFDAY